MRLDTWEQRPAAAAARTEAERAVSARGSDDGGAQASRASVGHDERRMQVRAYELWMRLLGSGRLPDIADLNPSEHPALAPFGVVLDLTRGQHDPQIAFLGEGLAAECGVERHNVLRVSSLPERSLLARIAGHYLKALVSPEPIGFEAEFVNQRGKIIHFRGILLPFSGGGGTLDFVFGVINWKEEADRALIEELLAELDEAARSAPQASPAEAGAHCTARASPGSRNATLPALDLADLAAIEAAGGKYTLMAVARNAEGAPVVLGEVKRGPRLHDEIAARALR